MENQSLSLIKNRFGGFDLGDELFLGVEGSGWSGVYKH